MSNDGRSNPVVRTLLILTACYVVGFMGSIAVNGALDFWYVTLKRPAWAPPVWFWLPAFTLVFGFLGFALALLAPSSHGKGQGAIISIPLTTALTGIWQWIFFAGHQLIPALIGAIVLALASAISAGLTLRIRPIAGYLLIVVTLWNTYLVLFTASVR